MAAMPNTKTRGTRVQAERSNWAASTALVLPKARSASTSPRSPRAVKIASAQTKEGIVVHNMWRMCSNSSAPATAGARLVVSDSGDILSPKYAPEITAPAVAAGDSPRPWATPTRPMPRVPAVVQELPMAREATAQSTALDTKNQAGSRIFMP